MKIYQAKDGSVRKVETPATAGTLGAGAVENHGDAMREQGAPVEPARGVAGVPRERDAQGRWV